MIRITGGELRGRHLGVPRGIRPTTQLARKAAFDILGTTVRGARVLDAAAGSGAYGFEALSRGAATVTFVESNRGARTVLTSNAAALGVGGQCRIEGLTVAQFLRQGSGGELFEVVFHDPPYGLDSEDDLTGLLARLASGGVLFHERGDDRTPVARPSASERRRYGTTRFFIYRR